MKFFKDNQGLPYIDLDGLRQEAAIMLLETAMTVELKKSKEVLDFLILHAYRSYIR